MSERKGRQALPVILDRLHDTYPNARYELDWDTPLELLVATILAAQCTDERVNQVTRTLFKKYPDARAYEFGVSGVAPPPPAPPGPTAQLSFVVPDAAPGEFLTRLRVDGVESRLINRDVTPPVFDDTRKVTVT